MRSFHTELALNNNDFSAVAICRQLCNDNRSHDKGTPVEKQGRKATGLTDRFRTNRPTTAEPPTRSAAHRSRFSAQICDFGIG